MWDVVAPRLEDLARRAGVRGAHPAAVAAVLLVCVLAAGWAAWRWWPQGDAAGGEVVIAATAPQAVAVEPTSTPAPAEMLVHVAGAVRRPGVYELAPGSRVIDAVEAAGGALPDAVIARVNLARPATDGEQILIPSEDDPVQAPAAVGGAGSAPASGGMVDINTADAASLDTLPGVGPSTAEKIIAEREKNGPFASLDDLSRVSGIGPKKIEQLAGLAGVR